tara:strand:+ start:690 stop:839 length:150 start_codon:yes stop_codon:yes gene_type:complete
VCGDGPWLIAILFFRLLYILAQFRAGMRGTGFATGKAGAMITFWNFRMP